MYRVTLEVNDRALLWNQYVIPHWSISIWRVLHWDKFAKPTYQPPYAVGAIETWWINQGKP